MDSFVDTYFSMVKQLIDNNEYFKFQFLNVENKTKMDIMDQDGLNSDPNFQRYVFSAEEYFQDFTILTDKIEKPVLIITGEYDDAVGPEHYRLFHFQQAEVHVLKASHHPYVENQQDFKDAIVHFLKKQNHS